MIKKLIRKLRGFCFSLMCRQRHIPKILGKIHIENRNIEIGTNVIIYSDVKFWGDGKIIIGNNVKIGDHTMIYASRRGGVCIGDNTIIAANCYIIDMDHGIEKCELIMKQEPSIAPVVIGSDCWLAENVTVLKGTVISDGCVVGAKSLVNRQYEPYSIIVGIPGKAIKKRT